MNLLVVLFVHIIIISQNELKLNANDDSYWKEFNGRIPNDAIKAGTDKGGNPIYIGQVAVIHSGLIPATIYPGSKSVKVVGSGRVDTTDKNIQILCSQHPIKYQWKATEAGYMHLLGNCMFVLGGDENGGSIFIGRGIHQMEQHIGKILPDNSHYRGLWLSHDNTFVKYTDFEVLSYNCSAR